MHTDQIVPHRTFWLETAVLVLITPFLLFPEVSTVGTFFSLLFLAFLWLYPKSTASRLILPQTPINIAILMFLLMLGVSILVTADIELTLPKATGLLLGITVWRYISLFCTNQRMLWLLICGFVVVGLGFTILGVLNANWLAKIPVLEEIASQLPGASFLLPESAANGVHTNQIASIILIWLPLLISLLLGWQQLEKPVWIRLVVLVLFVIGAVLLLLTQSRSGYIGMAGTLFVLLFLWRQQLPVSAVFRKWITAVILLMMFVGIGGLMWLGPERITLIWQDPNQESVVGNLSTIGFRQEVWQWGVAAAGDFPFTGTGLGTFRQVARRLYPLNVTPSYDIAHAHNIFLQTALDLGIPGLIAYGAILLIVGWLGWEVGKKDVTLRPFSLGILSGIIALHLFGMTDALALGAKPGLLFWMGLGLMTAMYRIVTH